MANDVIEDRSDTLEWANGHDPKRLPEPVRRAFSALDCEFEIRGLQGGLLNQSFHVRTREVEYVLQRVSDVFSPEIHNNIQSVTTHLKKRGIVCAGLVPNIDGGLVADLGEAGCWRLMPHLGGTSFETIQSIAQAHSAGLLVGRFHAAMLDFDSPLAPLGIPYRETASYLDSLRVALVDHSSHRLADEMGELGRLVLQQFADWGAPVEVPHRVIHGDLKLSNLLFEDHEPPGRDIAFALIDLDTLMRGPLWIELGDAWRSWCDLRTDDPTEIRFDLEVFEHSLVGFLKGLGTGLSHTERDSLVMAPERIALELCARFVTDALEETYFAWDDSTYATRGDHNAARAVRQWKLCESMQATRTEREAILHRLTQEK